MQRNLGRRSIKIENEYLRFITAISDCVMSSAKSASWLRCAGQRPKCVQQMLNLGEISCNIIKLPSS